jgi:hypothetical protein
LHISEIDIASRTVTITNTGVNSDGGFVTDTGGRDTILFVDANNALRAYSTTTRQVAPDPYQGIQAIGDLDLYGLLWAGDWLITAHTNYTDTLIVTFHERGRPATPFDTLSTRIPSLRRLIYVEEDATVLELARANQIPTPVQVYPNPVSDRFWLSGEGIQQVTLRDLYAEGSFIPGKPTPPNMSYPTSPKACTSCKSKPGAAFIPFACKNYKILFGRRPAPFGRWPPPLAAPPRRGGAAKTSFFIQKVF